MVHDKNRVTTWLSRPPKTRLAGLGALVAATVAAAAFGGSPSTPSTSGSSSGPITIGLVTTLSGPAAANFYGNLQGAQARIDLQNAQGGVNGHQLDLIGADDQTSFQGASSAMSELIQAKHVFGIIDLSDFTADAYRIAQQAAVPVVGFPTDGPEWGQKPNTNMVSIIGNVAPEGLGAEVNTVDPNVAKLVGAKNVAALAIAAEQPSVQGAESFVKAAATIGLKVGYKDYSIPIGSTNVAPIVLGMKAAGIDGFQSGLLNNTNFAILQSARQEHLNLVAPILEAGYGQDVVDEPATVQAAQGAIFQVFQRPVEEPNAEVKVEQAAFAKYEKFTGVPSIGWTFGWIAADLFIQGLHHAGTTPTRTTFLDALRNLKGYDAEGLYARPVDLSLAGFGTPPKQQCYWFTKLEGSKFVPLNGGKAICGTNVG